MPLPPSSPPAIVVVDDVACERGVNGPGSARGGKYAMSVVPCGLKLTMVGLSNASSGECGAVEVGLLVPALAELSEA